MLGGTSGNDDEGRWGTLDGIGFFLWLSWVEEGYSVWRLGDISIRVGSLVTSSLNTIHVLGTESISNTELTKSW